MLGINSNNMNLADHLAVNRTNLANERTFLSYTRTALTLFIGGISIVQFFDSIIIQVIGWIFIPSSIFVFLNGLAKFETMKQMIYEEKSRGLKRQEGKNNIFSLTKILLGMFKRAIGRLS